MSKSSGAGRFGNQLVRALALNLVARKHDLKSDYQGKAQIAKIGIKLFSGKKVHKKTETIRDGNYISILNRTNNAVNLRTSGYFQTRKITGLIHQYLQEESVREDIMSGNKYKNRYGNNNDCFIHVRLGDVQRFNPGLTYYEKILKGLKYDNLYISSDTPGHKTVQHLIKHYGAQLKNDITDIFLFAPTCKHLILSYGTFSAMLGYLAYHSQVYCLPFDKKYAWDWNAKAECDMFRDKNSLLGPWQIVKP